MIDMELVDYLAGLSRLELQTGEKQAMTAELERILAYMDVLNQGLGVMDTTATSLSMDNHIPILVFALKDPENIYRVITGEQIGTLVKEEQS